MAYLHPGVYVEEIPSGSKPIEAVGTSTAAFIGYTTKGPMAEPTLISKWDEYDKNFGGVRNLRKLEDGDPMGLSVSAFFQNGGSKTYIARLADQAKKAVGYVDHPEQIGKKALKFTAVDEGVWANSVVMSIKNNPVPDDDGSRNYDVFIKKEVTDENGKVTVLELESFLSVSLNPAKSLFIENAINDDSKVVTVTVVDDVTSLIIYSDQYLGVSISGNLTDVSLDFSSLNDTKKREMKIGLDGDTRKTITLDKSNFASLDDVASDIQEKVRALSSGGGEKAYAEFACVAEDNKLVLTSGSRKSGSYVDIDSTYNIAVNLKLGIDTTSDYVGYSKSGDLSALGTLDLTDTTLYPDDSAISISGTIDGAEFSHILNRVASFHFAEASNQLDTIDGISCSPVDANYLQLTSDAHTSTSAVVINSEIGLAPRLKLGTTPVDVYGAEEITGQESHENTLLIATSISGDLDDNYAATITTTDPGYRTLNITIDGSEHPIVLDADTYDTVEKFRAGIESKVQAIGGNLSGFTVTAKVGISAGKFRLVLTSPTNTATSAITVRTTDPLAIALHLGVRPEDAVEIRGIETTAMENKNANLRTILYGQESADIHMPRDRLNGGEDGNLPGQTDYEGIFTKFVKFRDVNIICMPGQSWTVDGTGESATIIQRAIAHAEKMKNRMVIVDPPRDEIKNATAINRMVLPSQTYCVVYYPWIEVANRFYHAERNPGLPKKVYVPPSGYAAGMWAKIDNKRGVWKAPAGMETGLLGLVGLEHKVEDDEQDFLNPWGINCLRTLPGAGRAIWGARTRATKADPEWRYVPVRRTAILIEQSIYNGIQWAVFEPNDHRLWSSLRANIGNFMNGLFRAGAFQGEKASDAYFVRCNLGDTMTQGDIDAGQVIVIVGFAPLKPAEFVIVRIQQKVNLQ